MLSLSKRALACGFSVGLMVALAPSCSGGGPGGVTSSFCNDYSTAYCDYAIRCGQVASGSRNDCVTYFTGSFCNVAVASSAKGYQTFDSTKGKACTDAISKIACDGTSALSSDACDGLFTAAVDTGGGCFEDADCKNEADGCGGSGCMKTCQVAGAQGKPCPKSGTCNTGLRCDRTTTTCVPPGGPGTDCSTGSSACDATSFCDNATDTCVALPTAGQACRTSSPRCTASAFCNNNTCQPKLGSGVTCTGFDSCESGLFCDSSMSPASCKATKAAGGTCTTVTQCQAGLRCTGGFCAAPKTAGQTCSGFNDCEDSLYCDRVLRTCNALVYTLKAGESCTADSRSCTTGLNCKGAAANADGGVGMVGSCTAKALGDSCTRFGSNCPEHAFCNLSVDGGSGSCTTSAVGSPCSFASECQAGGFCENSLCAPLKQMGATCTNSSSCVSPLSCLTSASGAKTCGKLGDIGASCSDTPGTSSCLFPLTCTGGTCQHGGATGEPCLSGVTCISGACNPDGGVCGPKLPEGGECTFFGGACESGRCTNGKCQATCM
jgi:hypothetical protein